ncbi:hypothetical protein GCM10027174_45540 [Salinifilum aidingensis]
MAWSRWHTGNAAEDGADYRGWLLGHFIEPADDVRNTKNVEVKWGVHPAGQTRDQWAPDYARTTLVLLIHGRFRIDLADDSALLTSEGDYLVWEPSTAGKPRRTPPSSRSGGRRCRRSDDATKPACSHRGRSVEPRGAVSQSSATPSRVCFIS